MSTRSYDYILQLASTANFSKNQVVLGANSNAIAEILAVQGSNLKVKLANAHQSFSIGEYLLANLSILNSFNVFTSNSTVTGTSNVFSAPTTQLSDSLTVYLDDIPQPKSSYVHNQANNTIQFLPKLYIDVLGQEKTYIYPDSNVSYVNVQSVSGNAQAYSFIASNITGYTTTANSVINAIYGNPYIAEKNTLSQTPIVRLYSIYYPGEWYPYNANNNPTKSGEGFPWPFGFPLRYAEFIGDQYSDLNFCAYFDNASYKVLAIDTSGISIDSGGKIGTMSLTIFNFDGTIGRLIENSKLAGYNSSNSTSAYVNSEMVRNIDPRTISDNVYYVPAMAAAKGANAAFDYANTVLLGDTWTSFIEDSRDLSGAVVEVKTTYAKFLDYWPEYSTVRSVAANVVNLYTGTPYRVGDIVTTLGTTNTATVISIAESTVYLNSTNLTSLTAGSKLLIKNPDADKDSYLENVFIINSLDAINDSVAEFELIDYMSYFKNTLPKRKFYNAICPWSYKGAECKYNPTGPIMNSIPQITANGMFTIANEATVDPEQDICAKTIQACELRRNIVNFGGFPSVKQV